MDLNCDLGEGAGQDALLMPWVTSANVACGAHAGDPATMRATVVLARERGVAVGAHPGYADREHFGRRELVVPPEAVGVLVEEQVRALQRIASDEGVRLAHVKPHGALYNQLARDEALAQAVARAVARVDPSLLYFGLAGSRGLAVARKLGLRVVEEAFADRTYGSDGALTPRSRAGALVGSEEAAVAQALALVREGGLRSLEGAWVRVRAETICVHGDGPHAAAFSRRLREAMRDAGVAVRAPASGDGGRTA